MTAPLDRVTRALAGRYRIERELGEGGMATVYLAHDERHGRKVAVKVLRADLASTLGPDRFLREIKIAANLSHPHIVPLYDSGEADEMLFYVMPYVEGETLGDRLRREGRVPVEDAVGVLREVSDALSFAHSRGVVHRDIKPDNVMITNRHAVVTDFGVAKAVSGATTAEGITNVGVAVGTPAYMAPEQVAADPHIDHRADIYALGTLAYELLSGKPPFAGESPQKVLAAHVTQQPDPVSTHCDAVPRDLESVIMRCLAKQPEERWQSADQIWTELGTIAHRTSGAGPALAHEGAKRHAIVVLPFANQSPDPENEYVSDGLTEELITDLSKIKALSVISRTSAMQLKGTDKDMRTIGRELGVRYVLEGSVRRAGSSLRITAQLIDAMTDEQIWADKYAGTMDDVFDLQERVSREIVGALNVTLTSDEERQLSERPIQDVRVFELYSRARLEERRYGESVERAQELLSQAMAIEGETAPLVALMGWTKITQMRSGLHRDMEPLKEAEAAAGSLLDRDPDSSYGHALLGYAAYERGDVRQAVRSFREALKSNPNDADSLFHVGVSYIAAGQNEHAADTARRLLAIDPLSTPAWLLAGVVPWFVGQHEAGVEYMRHAIGMDPENLIGRWSAGYMYACLDRVSDAAEHAEVMRRAAPDIPYTRQLLALIDAMHGRHAAALECLAPVDATHLDGHQLFHLAESFGMAGDADRALDLLDQAVERGFYPYPYITTHCPLLEPLRGDARFHEISAKAKRLVEAFG